MEEIYEEEPSGGGFDLERLRDIVRRRHMQFLVPFFVGWLLVWAASFVLPRTYKSTTLILVEQPSMPKNYVEPNVIDNLQDRLQSITQQLESRTRLMDVITRLHLYEHDGTVVSPDAAVERMRKNIKVELVRDPSGEINAFKVSFSSSSPVVAQKVTAELTSMFITQSLKVRQQQSKQTTQFLETQLAAARERLADQEAKVRAFQTAHQGELPTQQTTNLELLSGLETQLTGEQDALRSAEQQRVYYQSLVEQYKSVQPVVHTSDGAPVGLVAIDQQLDKMRAQLADLSSRYTDAYPDVQNLKVQIAKLEKQRAHVAAELKDQPASAGSAVAAVDSPQAAQLVQMQGQLHSVEAEIASRKQAIASLQSRIGSLQGRLNATPAAEQELADLNRGYTQSQADYNDLLKKESDSQMATSMEQMQEGERFTVQDPANLPQKPDFPNRLKFCAMGIAFGLLMGIGLAGVLEFIDDRMYSGEQIKDLLPVPVISEVPPIVTPEDERNRRRKTMVGWSAAAVILVIVMAGAAFSYLRS